MPSSDVVDSSLRLMDDDFLDFENRKVAQDEINGHLISTVFLGLDHSLGLAQPVLYETMIFCHHGEGCDLNDYQQRYTSEDEARAGHQQALELVHLEAKL